MCGCVVCTRRCIEPSLCCISLYVISAVPLVLSLQVVGGVAVCYSAALTRRVQQFKPIPFTQLIAVQHALLSASLHSAVLAHSMLPTSDDSWLNQLTTQTLSRPTARPTARPSAPFIYAMSHPTQPYTPSICHSILSTLSLIQLCIVYCVLCSIHSSCHLLHFPLTLVVSHPKPYCHC